jgi:hypothetical protein
MYVEQMAYNKISRPRALSELSFPPAGKCVFIAASPVSKSKIAAKLSAIPNLKILLDVFENFGFRTRLI